MSEVKTGFKYLPKPIIDHMRRSIRIRTVIPHVYHVTELIYCLRKAYYIRTHPDSEERNVKGLWNIYRGSTFDYLWSPLFEYNQRNYILFKEGVGIQGTFDFIYIDEKDGTPLLYDLKMPASVFYKKKEGVGPSYKKQVQTYLEMAHQCGEFLDVHRGRTMMVAEDIVCQDFEEDPTVLNVLFVRGFFLDKSLSSGDSSSLWGPAEDWECGEAYCPADEEFRKECKLCKKEEEEEIEANE